MSFDIVGAFSRKLNERIAEVSIRLDFASIKSEGTVGTGKPSL